MSKFTNSITAERERAKAIIREGERLHLSGEIVSAGIKSGMSVTAFLAEYDEAAALADEITASAKAAGG